MVIDGIDVPEESDYPVDQIAPLISRVAVGDRASFSELYDLMSAPMFGLIRRVLVDQDQSEEVLKEVFLEVWRTSDDFDPERGQGRSWLLKIVHRRAIDRARSTRASVNSGIRASLSDTEVMTDNEVMNDGEIISNDVAALAATAPEETPPIAVKQSLLAQLDALIDAGEPPSALRDSSSYAVPKPADILNPAPLRSVSPAGGPIPEFTELDDDDEYESPRTRKRLGLRLVAALAAFALVASVGAGLINIIRPAPSAGIAALQQITQAADAQNASTFLTGGGDVVLTWSAAQGRAVLMTDGMSPAPSGHTYELWFVRGQDAIPAGTFDPNSEGRAAVLASGEMHEGDVIAVTVEVAGGSPTGLPSEQLVFAIPTNPPGQAS